jgi:hypothetical protein
MCSDNLVGNFTIGYWAVGINSERARGIAAKLIELADQADTWSKNDSKSQD